MKERVAYWSAYANERVQCPVPGCGHIGDTITKAHCRLQHGIEREEVQQKHGKPFRIIAKTGVMVDAS